MKIHITDIYTQVREVELPAECPKCGFKIGEGARLTCMQYTYEEQGCIIQKVDDDELLDDWGSVESFGEAQMITGLKCANCDTPLIQAEEEELPDGPVVLKAGKVGP